MRRRGRVTDASPAARGGGHDEEPSVVPGWLPWTLAGAGVLFLVATGVVWMYLMMRARGDPVDVPSAFLRQTPLTAPTLLLVPGIVWLSRRFPLRLDGWRSSLSAHVLGAGAMLGAHGVLSAVGMQWAAPEEVGAMDWSDLLWSISSGWFYLWILTYLAVLGSVQAYENLVEARRRQRAADRLEARLLETQLASLRGRLQPHFLCNALQAAAGLFDENPRAARTMLANLGDLLRTSLATTRRQIVPLEEEVAFVRRYLEIQTTRFRDRLNVHVDVPEELRKVRVPGFVLQPLVENALRHGVAPSVRPGRVEVAARREDGYLALVVRDDGGGERPEPPEAWTEGVGLSSTRKRLRGLYGGRHRMDVRLREAGGVQVEIYLPLEAGGNET